MADLLLAYGTEHVPHTLTPDNINYTIASLSAWWVGKYVADVTPTNCRAYAETKAGPAARRDLETLRAAINYWHKHKTALPVVPAVIMPPKPPPRDRWLTRPEARRLRHAAARVPHLYRFIVIGLLTGSRSGAILGLKWDWIDLENRTMRRRAPEAQEASNKRTPTFRIGRVLTRILRGWKRQDATQFGDKYPQSGYVVHEGGHPVKRIKRSWATACAAAKLDWAMPHHLRHTRSTWLMQAAVPIWEAAGSVGMTPEVMQSTYGHHHPDFQKNAAEV